MVTANNILVLCYYHHILLWHTSDNCIVTISDLSIVVPFQFQPVNIIGWALLQQASHLSNVNMVSACWREFSMHFYTQFLCVQCATSPNRTWFVFLVPGSSKVSSYGVNSCRLTVLGLSKELAVDFAQGCLSLCKLDARSRLKLAHWLNILNLMA